MPRKQSSNERQPVWPMYIISQLHPSLKLEERIKMSLSTTNDNTYACTFWSGFPIAAAELVYIMWKNVYFFQILLSDCCYETEINLVV